MTNARRLLLGISRPARRRAVLDPRFTAVATIALVMFVVTMAASAGDGMIVASGSFDRTSWALRASDGRSGSYCVTVEKPRGRLDGSSCGSIFGPGEHRISYIAHTGPPGPDYVAGPVLANAVRVTVTFWDGTELTIPAIAPPQGLAPNIRFYVRFMPCTSSDPKKIVGVDTKGLVVASISVRQHQIPGGSHC